MSRPLGRRTALLLLLLLPWSSIVWVGPAAAQERIPLEEYVARLERAIDLAGSAGSASDALARMREVRDALGLPVLVETPGGEVLIPADPIFREETGSGGDDLRIVADHLTAALGEAGRTAEASAIADDRIREDLDAAAAAVRGDESLLQRLRRRAVEILADLLFRLFRYEGIGTVGTWLLLIVVVAGLVWLVRRLGLGIGIVPERRSPEAAARAESAVDWRRLAEEAAARGDLAEAIRCRYHALLTELAANGWVREDPSLTAGEARAAVGRRRPELYPDVARATGVFERVAYGLTEPGPDDLDSIRRAEEAAAR